MEPWLIILICVAVVLSVIIIISKVRNKSNKANEAVAPMSEPDERMVKLVEEAKQEALEERERLKNIPNEVNSEIVDFQMLEDLLQEEFENFEDIDYSKSSPVIERKATMESFINVENFTDKIIENCQLPDDVTAYISNRCTLSGSSFTDGAVSDTSLTISGSDVRMGTSIDGKKTDMLLLGDKMFIINPNQNTYLELSDSFLKLMGKKKEDIRPEKIGVSPEFTQIIPVAFSALFDGEESVCFEYKSENKIIRIYTVEGKFKAMLSGENEEKLDCALKADCFSSAPDMNMLSLEGLSKAGMFAFFKDMIN